MYIFELITNFIKGKKYKKLNPTDFTPRDGEDLIENSQDCEHFFMPLDSSNEYFGCKYCGIVVEADKLNNSKFKLEKS